MHLWNRLPLWAKLGGPFILLYLFTRWFRITSLPVFADEAIYIRWAQLLSHDISYLFFALNDGKPPLFIWSLVPFLSLNLDPLMAARSLSALVGLVQLLVVWKILRVLKGSLVAQVTGLLVVIVAPFWFFHHRMALMDSLLTLGISISLLGFFLLDRVELGSLSRHTLQKTALPLLVTGLGWGIALLTKTPALFLAPVFLFWAFSERQIWEPRPRWSLLAQRLLLYGFAGALGLGIFFLLKFSPAFGSLFGRSTDFTYSVSEILAGEWQSTLTNYPKVLGWLSTYLRPELLSLPLFALLISRKKVLHARLLLSALIWAFPLLLLGRVLHARYFLPVAPFITISAALFLAEVWELLKKFQNNLYATTAFTLVAVFFLIGSLRFMFFAFLTPSQIPFVLDDREQYLTEWSSGHGIREVRDRLFERAQNEQRTVVVTEGSFGTLPDGLLLYFDRRPEIEYVRIDGLAQYPVREIPDWVREEAKSTETWLLVNEHRLALDPKTSGLTLLDQYARPYGAPRLQLYQIQPE